MSQVWETRIHDAWWPRVQVVSGRIFVAYGSANITLEELDGNLGVVRAALVGPGWRSPRWIRPGVLTAWRETAVKDHSERGELSVTGDWSGGFQVVDAASLNVGGNFMEARDGEHISWSANGHRINASGRIYGGHGGAVGTADGWFCYPQTNDGLAIIRRQGSQPPQVFPAEIPLHQMACGPRGVVVYGGYGAVRGIDESGEQDDLTSTPWRFEGVGPIWVSELDDRIWFATTTATPAGDAGIIIRPWGEHEAIWVKTPSVSVDIAQYDSGRKFIIATCTDRGRGKVEIVNALSSRAKVVLPPVVDEPIYPAPVFSPAQHDVAIRTFGGPEWSPEAGTFGPVNRRRPLVFVDARNGHTEIRQRADYAKSIGAELGIYVDEANFNLNVIPDNLPVTVVPLQQMYPHRAQPPLTGQLDSTAERLVQIRESLTKLRARYPRVGVVMAFYRQIHGVNPPTYNWPIASVIDLQAGCWNMVNEFKITDIFCFVQNRAGGKDGIDSRSDLKQSYDRMRVAANAWMPRSTPSASYSQSISPSLSASQSPSPSESLSASPSPSEEWDDDDSDTPIFVPPVPTPTPSPHVPPHNNPSGQGGFLRSLRRLNFRRIFRRWFG